MDGVVLKVAKSLLSLTEKNAESSECCDVWNTGGKNSSASVSLGRGHVTGKCRKKQVKIIHLNQRVSIRVFIIH